MSLDILMYCDKQDINTTFTSKSWQQGNKICHHLANNCIMALLKGTYLWCCASAAFICHHNSFLIYGSLEQPTIARWTRVTHVSVGSALIISAAFAVAGYSTFTGYTQGTAQRRWSKPQMEWDFFNLIFSGDIFENYCRDDNLATFGRFSFGLSIVTTFPLECFVTREVQRWGGKRTCSHKDEPICTFFFAPSSSSRQVVSNVFWCRELTKAEHAGLTVLIVAVCTSMSLAFDCLGVVLELNVSGCLCVYCSMTFYAFLFPVMGSPLLCHPGRSECHSTHLHYSVCVLPQTLPWTVVSGWEPDAVYPDFSRHVCDDHRFDHDWALPTRLFPWSGNVLLCRC